MAHSKACFTWMDTCLSHGCGHVQARVASGKGRDEKMQAARKAAKAEHKQVGQAFYKQMTQDSDYQGADYEVFDNWLNKTNEAN